jgi:hypothetical protein
VRNNISVQEEAFSIAQRGVKTRCAIAWAIMVQVPAARHIKVDRDTIAWLDVDRQERLTFRTPKPAREFIEQWDRGEEVKPFSFTLTDSALIERRPPRTQTARARVQRPTTTKPVRKPGSRMTRGPSEHCQ